MLLSLEKVGINIMAYQKITFKQALKRIFSFLFKEDADPKNDQPDTSGEEKGKIVTCSRCNEKMAVQNNLSGIFIRTTIYKCEKCGMIKEYQYNLETNELMKEINIYDKFTHSSSSYMEVVNMLSYNEYAIDRLWEVCGCICYPVLMKTEFSDNVDLVFIRVEDDLSRNVIEAFLIDTNMVGKVQVRKSDDFSYFMCPYLNKLPHSSFIYASTPIERNPNIAYVAPIRYRHRISSNSQNSYVHELYIIEDFPIQSFGIEIFVKFCTFDDTEIPIKELIGRIDLKNIIMGNDINMSEGYYIQNSRMSKINIYSMSSNKFTEEERRHFYKSIKEFFDVAT